VIYGVPFSSFLGDRLQNGLPFAIRPLSSLCDLSVMLVYCGQTVVWTKMKLGTEVGLGPGHIVLDGDPAPPKGNSPQFSAHVHSGQMAGWIKMLLDTEVGLGPGDCVRWGPNSPQNKGHSPNFGPCLLWPNGRPSQLLLSTC